MSVEFQNRLVSEIISDDFEYADVFKRFGIEFCCSDDRSLQDVCSLKGVPVDRVIYAIEHTPKVAEPITLVHPAMSVDRLVEQMEYRMHRYFRSEIPYTNSYLEQVREQHGSSMTYLHEVQHWWKTLTDTLSEHLIKLELAVYPYIKRMAEHEERQEIIEKPAFGSIIQLKGIIHSDHQQLRDSLFRLEKLTDSYQNPMESCTTMTVAFKKMHRFSTYLPQYLDVHNAMIFPKASMLEKELVRSE
jgi:regulator of cell morphogenesis and NO signaling